MAYKNLHLLERGFRSSVSAAYATLRYMAFKVYRDSADPFQEYGDEDSYRVIEGGALEIKRKDGSKVTVNSSLWASVEEPARKSVYAAPQSGQSDDLDVMNTAF
jgi:hypothetical protein